MSAFIAQSDCVTAYGWGTDALWDGLMSGRTAIRTSQRFADRSFVSNQLAEVPDLLVQEGESRAMAMLSRLLAPLVCKLDPATPLILATTVGEIEFVELSVLNDWPDVAPRARPQHLLDRLKKWLGLTGPGLVFSSACASSSAALTRAAAMVNHDEAASVLVVSCDAISEFVYSGFSTLLSLCESPASPFDASRSGLTLGEAAAYAVVTRNANHTPTSESANILGWGSTTDAVHMTAPDRNAGGLSRAIGKALAMANLMPADINLIAAHGTATLYSDAMEMVAFRAAIVEPRPTLSIKGGIGHTLAPTGLLQVLVAARALDRGVLPPIVGLSIPDESAVGWVHGVPVMLDQHDIALSTNSGFGGVNTAVLLGRRHSK